MSGKMQIAILGLGSNIEPRSKYMEDAMTRIQYSAGKIVKTSSIYETEPFDMDLGTPNFLNCVILVQTKKNPEELLNTCLSIEKEMGRIRHSNRHESRKIDIDLLHYTGELRNTQMLILPHPKIHERMFVLKPLQEVMPEFIHPVLKKDVNAMMNDVSDALMVNLWKSV